ncbi:MAG: M1 family metallopeptidase [Flavobacteriaceae bacterium]
MKKLLIFGVCLITQLSFSQTFTKRDSLQGGLPFERTCFDVQEYRILIEVNVQEKSISGLNIISFNVLNNTKKIQLDLFENMKVDSIRLYNKEDISLEKLSYKRECDAVFIEFDKELEKGKEETIFFFYSGKPQEAKNAPWDGGFVWKKDSNGKPFVGVAVQGTGASLWYPCKDSQSDEAEYGAVIAITVPDDLVAVSNGRNLADTPWGENHRKWVWIVNNPINNYNITLNIGDYVHFSDTLDDLDIDYWVLRENEEKAKKHFEDDVKPMLACFQEKFGDYPFMEDGYKLVETPYLGMEHQSAVAYGNKYKKGYLGNDISGSGVGKLFDFIIIHETGHEWFGNSVTSKDIADMWIHEAFTTYSEAVYVECRWGYEKAMQYINGQSRMVENQKPIVGQFGVNFKPKSTDMYYKGALMLNTIRHIINDDEKWWKLILDYSNHFKHQIIEAKDVIDFFTQESGINLKPVFEQYLYHNNLPELQIETHKKGFTYYWKTDVKNFEMPVEIILDGKTIRLQVTNQPQRYKTKSKGKISVNSDKFFIRN